MLYVKESDSSKDESELFTSDWGEITTLEDVNIDLSSVEPRYV